MFRWNPFIRFPVVSFLLLGGLLAALCWNLRDLQIRSDVATLLESDPAQKAAIEKFTDSFENTGVVVLDVACGDAFSAEGLALLTRLGDALLALESVRDVKSLTHSSKPVRDGLSVKLRPLVPRGTADPDELERLRAAYLSNPLLRDTIVSADSRHAALVLTLRGSFDSMEAKRRLGAELEAVIARFEDEGYPIELAGLPLVEAEVAGTIADDASWLLPLLGLFLAGVLWAGFRSLPVTLLVLGSQLLALAFIAGSLHLAGYPFTVYTLLLFPLWAGVHLTLLLHLVTTCQRLARSGGDAVVARALDEIGRSCAFATLTTLAGLLSLAVAGLPLVREAGLVGAYGVAVVFLATFGPTVGVLAVAERRRRGCPEAGRSATAGGNDRAAAWIDGLVKRRRLIGGGALATALVGAALLPLAERGVRLVEFLPAGSPTRAAAEQFDRSYGGYNVYSLGIDAGAEGAIDTPAFLRYLESVQARALEIPDVSGAYSYADVLATMNWVWQGEAPGSLALPDNPLLLGTFALALKAKRFAFFEPLSDPTHRRANLFIRTPDLPSARYLEVIDDIVAFAREGLPDGAALIEGEGLHTLLETERRLARAQVSSVGTLVLAVLLLLVALWRSVALAALAVVANLIPVLVVAGVAAALGIPLNAITVMTVAVTFGVALDDSVHLVTQWLKAREAGMDPVAAAAHAVRVKARPVIYTSLVMAGIFGLLAATSFPPVGDFAALCALGFVLAVACVFVLLPAGLAAATSRSGSSAGSPDPCPRSRGSG